MAHVAAVALAAAPSGAMPMEVPMEWKGRLQLASDLATTAQVIVGLVAERTGVPRSTGSFATAEAGEFTREKMRIALADLVCLGSVADKFSPTVAMAVIRFTASATAGMEGRLYALDVAGAYFHGAPLSAEEGSRD